MAERDATGHFVAGSSGNPAGRPRGAANKLNREIRELVRQALDEEGGVEYLKWAARKKPVAFMALLARLIPAEVRASLEYDGKTTLVFRDYTGSEHEVHGRKLTAGSNVELLPEQCEQPTQALEDDLQATSSRRRDPEPELSAEEKLDALETELGQEMKPERETWSIARPWESERPAEAICDDD